VTGYVVQKGSRFYAVIYEGVDPLTGWERRRWYPAGESRQEAVDLATRLAAATSAVVREPGPTLATYLLRQWLPAKEVSLRPSTWHGYRRLIELHVVPRLGSVSLRRLRRRAVGGAVRRTSGERSKEQIRRSGREDRS
jgi:hypothetical protein